MCVFEHAKCISFALPSRSLWFSPVLMETTRILNNVVFFLDMKLPFIFLLLSWAYIHIFGSKQQPFTLNIVIVNV